MEKIYKTHYDKQIDLPYRKIRYEMFQEFSMLLNDMLKCQKVYADP